MADAPGIERLLAALASTLRRRGDHHEEEPGETAAVVNSLAACLNPPSPPTRTRVLDAALSLMCFTAPEVWSLNVKFLLEAITTALSSSISCKVVHCEVEDKKVEELVVGSSFTMGDCDKLVATLLGILQSLEDCGSSHVLFETIMKVAISASSYKSLLPHSLLFYKAREKLKDAGRLLGSKLNSCLHMAAYNDSNGVPLRLCIWYIDPLILKTDILEILQEYTQRPYLHLKTELHERMSWRAIVRCLATSPIMFLETRTLLHNWFLKTGLVPVLDLQNALVWSILDVLSRPMWWDFSMDIGLRLPCSHAYFLSKDRELLHILSGSVSFKSFLDLVHRVQLKVYDKGNYHSTETDEQRDEIESPASSNSTWAMLMNFPQWIYFAIMLCICKNDGMPLALESFPFQALKRELDFDPEIHHAAAMFLSVILSPFDQIRLSELHSHISKLSRPCPIQDTPYHASQRCSQPEKSTFVIRSKKLRKPRPSTSEKSGISNGRCNSTDITLWLQQFNRGFTKFCRAAIDWTCAETKGKNLSEKAPCQLIAKIPLGILMSDPNVLDEEGCCLLLHYAATGAILRVDEEVQTIDMASSRSTKNFDQGIADAAEGTKWLHGTSVVFNLFEAVEDMTTALFDTEASQLDYICQLKSKAVKYLVKCATNISKGHVCKDTAKDVTMLIDLRNRLLQWKQQGEEHFNGCKNLDDAINNLNIKISHM